MIAQRRITMIRNKISRSFILHENQEAKYAKMCFIDILVPSLRRWGISNLICSQKRDQNVSKTNF